MAKYFDQKKWTEAIKRPDWYLVLSDDYKNLTKKMDEVSEPIREEIKKETYNFFLENLVKNKIALGKTGPNWDKERHPIDTVVVHHTSHESSATWQEISAVHLIRLYANYYSSPYAECDLSIKGQPIFSNHFRGKDQVFYAYHWLVRKNGQAERLLNDGEVGWHSGNWEVNCRSIAICLDGDFENSSPTTIVVSAIVKLINENYPQVSLSKVIGHREVNLKTTCPGNKFLDGWKGILLDKLSESTAHTER